MKAIPCTLKRLRKLCYETTKDYDVAVAGPSGRMYRVEHRTDGTIVYGPRAAVVAFFAGLAWKQREAIPTEGPRGTGYGKDRDGKTLCYECCAKQDRTQMSETGRVTLYLTQTQAEVSRGFARDSWKVTNWPGSLSFPVDRIEKGSHNIAGTRYDVWFTDGDGRDWWGVQYGENTQLCHCKRLKVTS